MQLPNDVEEAGDGDDILRLSGHGFDAREPIEILELGPSSSVAAREDKLDGVCAAEVLIDESRVARERLQKVIDSYPETGLCLRPDGDG